MYDNNVLGIIVEYNPLHNGHVYHFQEAKKISGAEAVVAVMSGPFLQRGEPAFASKWARAEMALAMGVDLVIELPVAYSCQPAEWFAFGAVSALDATGIVGRLCFGSESGAISWMTRVAEQLYHEPEPFQRELRERLKTGAPFPTAYSEAIVSVLGEMDGSITREALTRPNNTLGLHYLIAIKRLGSHIEPLTITRKNAQYDQADITDTTIASATAIRRLASEEGLDAIRSYVPDYTLAILRKEYEAGRAPVHWDQFYDKLLHQILSKSEADLRKIYEVTEGLERRIKKQLPLLRENNGGFETLLSVLKSKRYTRTKLQRMLTRILLNHGKDMLNVRKLAAGTPYLRILGLSDTGRKLLRRMKKTAKVPIVEHPARHRSEWLELDARASALYALAYRSNSADEWFRDYYEPPLFVSGGSDAK